MVDLETSFKKLKLTDDKNEVKLKDNDKYEKLTAQLRDSFSKIDINADAGDGDVGYKSNVNALRADMKLRSLDIQKLAKKSTCQCKKCVNALFEKYVLETVLNATYAKCGVRPIFKWQFMDKRNAPICAHNYCCERRHFLESKILLKIFGKNSPGLAVVDKMCFLKHVVGCSNKCLMPFHQSKPLLKRKTLFPSSFKFTTIKPMIDGYHVDITEKSLFGAGKMEKCANAEEEEAAKGTSTDLDAINAKVVTTTQQIYCDVTVNELAAYLENITHIPKKMSVMAESMYL